MFTLIERGWGNEVEYDGEARVAERDYIRPTAYQCRLSTC